MDERRTFELRRQSDDLVHTFDRRTGKDGAPSYKRRDGDFWITRREGWGWVAWDDTIGSCLGRPWDVLPRDQGDHPPEGDWVSRKGTKSYVYRLVYLT